jgi:hypothetical protein
MGLLHLSDHLLLPGYTSYRHTPYESPWPHNGAIADLAHAQGALVGYVHVADFPIDPPKEKSLSYELPADVAMGKVDYMEVMGFSDHHITAGIWYGSLTSAFAFRRAPARTQWPTTHRFAAPLVLYACSSKPGASTPRTRCATR